MALEHGSRKVYLEGLEEYLLHELTEPLKALRCEFTPRVEEAEIVFSGWDPVRFSDVRKKAGKAPVVVVGRHASVNAWLDALEAGADDYCVAPFERVHLGWILDSQLKPAKRAAAA